MKHLKYLFKFNENLYSKLTDFDTHGSGDFMTMKRIQMSEKNIKNLTDLFRKSKKKTKHSNPSGIRSFEIDFPTKKSKKSDIDIHVLILECEDDWFLVFFTNTIFRKNSDGDIIKIDNKYSSYKCDQWDGLLKCLKDNMMLLNILTKKTY